MHRFRSNLVYGLCQFARKQLRQPPNFWKEKVVMFLTGWVLCTAHTLSYLPEITEQLAGLVQFVRQTTIFMSVFDEKVVKMAKIGIFESFLGQKPNCGTKIFRPKCAYMIQQPIYTIIGRLGG